ncbi:MAG: hypothetical protein ACFFB3_08515 [Candidatus Hodarchaeota archaeon]
MPGPEWALAQIKQKELSAFQENCEKIKFYAKNCWILVLMLPELAKKEKRIGTKKSGSEPTLAASSHEKRLMSLRPPVLLGF